MFSPKKIHFFASIIFIFCFFGLNRGISFGGSAGVCAMGCAVAPVPTPNNMVSPQTYTQTIMQTMTKIAAVQQNLMLAEEFYQYMKSFAYMKASPGLFGAVSYIGNMTSGISSLASQGLTQYQNTATQFGGGTYAMSPAEFNNLSGSLGLTASTAGSLSSMSSTLSMLNAQNGGAGGLALINGASLATQAALTGAQATLNIMNYYQNRDTMSALQENIARTRRKQAFKAETPPTLPIPCRDMAAWPPQNNPNNNVPMSACETITPGTASQFNSPSGTGANTALRTFAQQQYNAAAASGQAVTPPTAPPINTPIPTTGASPSVTTSQCLVCQAVSAP